MIRAPTVTSYVMHGIHKSVSDIVPLHSKRIQALNYALPIKFLWGKFHVICNPYYYINFKRYSWEVSVGSDHFRKLDVWLQYDWLTQVGLHQ